MCSMLERKTMFWVFSLLQHSPLFCMDGKGSKSPKYKKECFKAIQSMFKEWGGTQKQG